MIDFEDNEFSFNPNFNIKFNLIKDTDNSVYNGIWYKLFTHKYEIKTRGVYENIDFYALGRFNDNTRKKLVREKNIKSIFALEQLTCSSAQNMWLSSDPYPIQRPVV